MPWKDTEKRKAMARFYGKRDRAKNRAPQAERMRKWRNKPENKERSAKYTREFIAAIRFAAIDRYSDNARICKGCGYSNVDALCIDHIADNGKAHRAEVGAAASFWLWLKRNNYPEGFQVLCHNCNFTKEVARRKRKADDRRAIVTERMP